MKTENLKKKNAIIYARVSTERQQFEYQIDKLEKYCAYREYNLIETFAKKMSSSAVEDIPNVGLAKRKALIAHFGSVKNIANANVEDLQKVTGIGALLANQIYLYFH